MLCPSHTPKLYCFFSPSAVLASPLLPLVFCLLWFVLLQLYLVPCVSSFRQRGSLSGVGEKEESLDIIPIPMVVPAVAAFLLAAPILHVVLAFVASDAPSLLTVEALVQLGFLVSLTSFLATLLSIRQIFEYLGMSYSTAVYTRWVSGIFLTVLCYPALRFYGLDSHFLPLLPVAIAMFAALGVVMASRKKTYTLFVL